MKKIIVFLLFLLTSQVSFSTDTSAVKYLPLAVGNKWVFNYHVNHPYPFFGYATGKITKDTLINNKKYFYLNGVDFLSGWIRFDTVTANLFKPDVGANCIHPYETLLDSLASKYLDSFYFCVHDPQAKRFCSDTSHIIIGGSAYKTKKFNNLIEITGTERRFAQYLGFSGAVIGDPWGIYYDLKGAVINGIVYGDTTITGLQPISTNIPEKFLLYQNYPNPFNPSTKIRFSLPSERSPSDNPSEGGAMNVKLIIYDILGQEVASLIPPLWGGQEGLLPGTYEVEWDGSDYPSGVYFYKLTTFDYSETKKMVLMK
jgi:hypothetical protein